MKIMMMICIIYLAVVTHAFIELSGDDDNVVSEWFVAGSVSLNYMAENSAQHTFGLGSSDSSNSGTNCDILVGVFTPAGSFGCVIDGIADDEVKFCDSYPDIPIYAFNKQARRYGTFVAVSQGCTDGLKINRLYMKNQSYGEVSWSYENRWIDSDGHTPGQFSLFQIDSEADDGYFMEQDWYYVPPEYEWYTEGSLVCLTDCNYQGGAVSRNVVCRQTHPSMHNYISWDESKCAGLTKPTSVQICPAGSCQWVQYNTNWNCLGSGSSASNKVTTGVSSAQQCQLDCVDYSYAGWWNDNSKQKCKCFHVCHEGGPTSGGVFSNIVYEQVLAGRRKY